MKRAMPKPTDAIPKVIMNGDTLNTATPMPFTTPMPRPEARPAAMPRVMDKVTVSGNAVLAMAITVAVTTEVTATIVPSERSKPPVKRASICPMDTITRYVD